MAVHQHTEASNSLDGNEKSAIVSISVVKLAPLYLEFAHIETGIINSLHRLSRNDFLFFKGFVLC